MVLGACVSAGGSGSPPPTNATPTTAEIEAASRFRATFGLRFDVAWIQAVHNAPNADTTFGIPLLPDEAAKVRAAQVAANAVSDIVAAYGRTVPDDWAGMYVDQTAGGTVVARFEANVEAHQAALEALLPAGARVDVRAATWTEEELRSFISRVEKERDWYATIGTELVTVEIAVLDHRSTRDSTVQTPRPRTRLRIITEDPPGFARFGTGLAPGLVRPGSSKSSQRMRKDGPSPRWTLKSTRKTLMRST
jgi:hypothetical protein